jgi:hypothetical protein
MNLDDEEIQEEVDINKKNRENYEQLMKESSVNLDGYYDKKNPFVKILLLLLGVVIVGGVIYYALLYFK